jgi:LacI family transcriptional regulator
MTAGRDKSTLADVARAAGVAPSTASRALNGLGELSPETRQAVLEASERLGYRPSPLARSLRTQRTSTVGFVVPDISSPYYAGVLRGAQLTLESAGYRVMLMDSERQLEVELDALGVLLEHQVDGILLATNALAREQQEPVLAGPEPPCVLFDSALPGFGAGSVTVENDVGMELLVDHLVGLGHSRIAVLIGALTESVAIERHRGFRRALATLGLEPAEKFERICEWTRESARQAARELLSGSARPTAVVGTSDDLALGCLKACCELGLRVPDDVSVASFDGPYYGEMLNPPLTALGYDAREIGRKAASLLIERMGSAGAERHDLRLPVRLIVRHSTAPPAHRESRERARQRPTR